MALEGLTVIIAIKMFYELPRQKSSKWCWGLVVWS